MLCVTKDKTGGHKMLYDATRVDVRSIYPYMNAVGEQHEKEGAKGFVASPEKIYWQPMYNSKNSRNQFFDQ